MLKFKKGNSNYVIPAWSGSRRVKDQRYRNDSTIYLREHIKSLQELEHDLSQITIAIAENPKESEEFAKYVNEIPKKIQNAKVEIIRRRNYGLSYGAFSDIFDIYGTQFDHYFFVEDDYKFSIDRFDSIMINMLNNKSHCGYLCGFATPKKIKREYRHASMSIGCVKTEAMQKLKETNGVLWPYPNKEIKTPNDYKISEIYGQRGFSQGLLNVGYEIEDVLDRYAVLYRERDMRIDRLGKQNQVIIEPC